MDKTILLQFIQKYHLNGLCNETKLSCCDSIISTKFITENKDLLGTIAMKDIDLPDSEFGIFNTGLINRVLNALDTEIDLNLSKTFNKYTSLTLSDRTMTSNIMLADLDIIKDPPELNDLPDSACTFKISSDFISKFNKAKSAITEANHMAFVYNETVGNQLQLILNYSEHNSDNIVFDLKLESLNEKIPVMKFNSDNFKEILNANRDCGSADITLYSKGMMKIEFSTIDYTATYYQIMLQ